jgi:hypothetical protein
MGGSAKRLFRTAPPKEFVIEILQHLRLLGLHDLRWFTREELVLDTLDEWLPLLEPYYLPCKAKRFLNEMDSTRIITILRHILQPHGYELHTQERMYKTSKTTLYQIQPVQSHTDLSGNDLLVEFK